MSQTSEIGSPWITTASGRIRLLKNGFVHVEIKTGHEQTPDNAKENLEVAMAYCKEDKRAVLLDIRGTHPLSPETRLIYMNPEMSNSFTALALVVSSDRMSRLMANIYMLLAKLPFPMRLCFEIEEAQAWLHKFK